MKLVLPTEDARQETTDAAWHDLPHGFRTTNVRQTLFWFCNDCQRVKREAVSQSARRRWSVCNRESYHIPLRSLYGQDSAEQVNAIGIAPPGILRPIAIAPCTRLQGIGRVKRHPRHRERAVINGHRDEKAMLRQLLADDGDVAKRGRACHLPSPDPRCCDAGIVRAAVVVKIGRLYTHKTVGGHPSVRPVPHCRVDLRQPAVSRPGSNRPRQRVRCGDGLVVHSLPVGHTETDTWGASNGDDTLDAGLRQGPHRGANPYQVKRTVKQPNLPLAGEIHAVSLVRKYRRLAVAA